MRQKNQARFQLDGALLLVAQLGALEFRKWLITGDALAIPSIRLGLQIDVSCGVPQANESSPSDRGAPIVLWNREI